MTQHTPGPWRISEARMGMGKAIMATGGEVIGSIMDMPLNDKVAARQEANARLIAAAPCLVEALEKIASYLRHLDNCDMSVHWDDDFGAKAAELEAALARARGSA